jgi:hypothetical protein
VPDGNLPDPQVMAAPIRRLAPSYADRVDGRRFIARRRDPALPFAEAAQKCSSPIGLGGR